MKLSVCRTIGRAVVARGSANGNTEGGGILTCSIKCHHGLLSPLVLRSSPTDRDHRWSVCSVMNRRGESIEKTLVGVRREIHRDTGARRHSACNFDIERHLAVGAVGISGGRICTTIHGHRTHFRRGDSKVSKESIQIVGVVAAAKLQDADTLARALHTCRKVVGLRNLCRSIGCPSEARLPSARMALSAPEMRLRLVSIVQPKNTLDYGRKIGRDFQSSSSPPILAARMPVTNEFDLKSAAEGAHWPSEYDRAPRNALTFHPEAAPLRECTDAREILGESTVCGCKFFAGQMTPLCDRRPAEFFDERKSP